MKFQYRAVMVCGYVHGGGDIRIGDLRATFEEAEKDLKSREFQSEYGDTTTMVEVVKVG